MRLKGADVVGIMELKAGQGVAVKNWLVAKLNQSGTTVPAYSWQGVVSSRQDGGTQEEYVFLWKSEASRLTLNAAGRPAPASLPGVIDPAAMAPLFASKGWSGTQQTAFFTALENSGYTAKGRFKGRGNALVQTAWWRVQPDAWNTLSQMATPQATINNPPTPLTQADLRQIANTVLDVDILRLITYGDRSPFLVNLQVGNPAPSLAVALLHAPGPQDASRTDAINIMALSRPIAAAGNVLLMGDFNIATTPTVPTARVYSRHRRPRVPRACGCAHWSACTSRGAPAVGRCWPSACARQPAGPWAS